MVHSASAAGIAFAGAFLGRSTLGGHAHSHLVPGARDAQRYRRRQQQKAMNKLAFIFCLKLRRSQRNQRGSCRQRHCVGRSVGRFHHHYDALSWAAEVARLLQLAWGQNQRVPSVVQVDKTATNRPVACTTLPIRTRRRGTAARCLRT